MPLTKDKSGRYGKSLGKKLKKGKTLPNVVVLKASGCRTSRQSLAGHACNIPLGAGEKFWKRGTSAKSFKKRKCAWIC